MAGANIQADGPCQASHMKLSYHLGVSAAAPSLPLPDSRPGEDGMKARQNQQALNKRRTTRKVAYQPGSWHHAASCWA